MEDRIYMNLKSEAKNIPIVFIDNLEKIDEYVISCNFSNLVIFTDRNIYNLYKTYFDNLKYPNIFIFDEGEMSKSIESYLGAVDYLLKNNIDRKALFVGIGGGVIGDVVGFLASTYKRGVKLIHVPTTLLSMVDSSIGGKTGINYGIYKNQIGTFYQPEMVIIYAKFINTLPKIELMSGFGEIIKYGYTIDKSILFKCEKYENDIIGIFQNKSIILELIQKSIKCKISVVEMDEKESRLREVLNFGHTIGHALESYYGYCLPHGIFVIFGMIAEMIVSHILFGFDLSHVEFLIKIIKDNHIELESSFDNEKIISIMKHDKKNIKDRIRMVLLKDICDYVLSYEVEEGTIVKALNRFKELIF